MKILVINGPNLNLLGSRKPEVYGHKNLEQLNSYVRESVSKVKLDFFQSNHEGEIVDRLQEANYAYDAVVINPGAFTHYSVAIRDAIEAIQIPVAEVHISNVHGREEFRSRSVVSAVCQGTVSGFGINGYVLAIHGLIRDLES